MNLRLLMLADAVEDREVGKGNDPVVEIIRLQQVITERLVVLGYKNRTSIETLSRQLAGIAVLGKRFSESTLPLFLTIDSSHLTHWLQLGEALRTDLDELSDSISDIREDLISLTLHLRSRIPS
jgi:hypothetical protein